MMDALRSLSRNGWLLADQALVSGMNFVTSAILARMLGVHAFGVFSIFYISLQYLNSIQLALIVSPMMSLAPQITNEREQRTLVRGIAGYQLLFSSVCCLGAAVFAVLAALHLLSSRMEESVWLPFLLTIFCFQCQDWFRRFCYLYDRGPQVFLNDCISYVGQVIFFLVLWKLHRMNVTAAYYGIAITSLVAFLAGFRSEKIGASVAELKHAIRRTWAFGRSLLVVSQFQWLGSQGILLIVAAVVSVNATSGIRAVITLFGPVNVLYQLMDNIIPVRAARAYSSAGKAGLLSYLRRTGVRCSILICVPVFAIVVCARPIMVLAFGKPFEAYAGLVAWQGLYTVLALFYRGLVYYHRTLGTTTVLATSALIVAVVSVGGCFLLAKYYGATGAMVALVLGQVFNIAIPLKGAMRGRVEAS